MLTLPLLAMVSTASMMLACKPSFLLRDRY